MKNILISHFALAKVSIREALFSNLAFVPPPSPFNEIPLLPTLDYRSQISYMEQSVKKAKGKLRNINFLKFVILHALAFAWKGKVCTRRKVNWYQAQKTHLNDPRNRQKCANSFWDIFRIKFFKNMGALQSCDIWTEQKDDECSCIFEWGFIREKFWQSS